MSGKRKVSDLQTALEAFGRRARGLTAENLASFPGVLEALFDEDALADPDERLRLAGQVRETIVRVTEGCRLAQDRQVGNALFAISEELHDLGVLRRVKQVHLASRTYYDRRDILLPRIVRELRNEFNGSESSAANVALSARARKAAQLLYRYAQPTLICVDAYDLCAKYAYALHVVPSAAFHTFKGVTPDSHSWLRPFSFRDHYFSHPEQHVDQHWTYGEDDVDAHLAPYGRTSESDSGLRDYAYYHKYLRALLRDPSGRDYVRESVPSDRWPAIQSESPLMPDEVDRLLSVQAKTYPDTAEAFVTNLRQDDEGSALHAKWIQLLSAALHGHTYPHRASWLHRRALSGDLLRLCISLQQLFPEETLSDVRSRFRGVVLDVMADGLYEAGAPFIASRIGDRITFTEDASMLYRDILKWQAVRYSRRRLEDGEAVWIDDPPDEGITLAAGLYVQGKLTKPLE
jgi:hypothetical protein